MDDTHKMLRAIINGQSAMKQELTLEIRKVDKKVDRVEKNLSERIDKLDIKIDKVEERLTERLDKIGLSLAELEDDTPTREEFDDLEKRVSVVETKVSLA